MNHPYKLENARMTCRHYVVVMQHESSQWIAEEEEREAESARRVREASNREVNAAAGKPHSGELLSKRRIEFKAISDEDADFFLEFLLREGKINAEQAKEIRTVGTLKIFEGAVTNEKDETETHLFLFKYRRELFKYEKKVDADGRILSWEKVPCAIADSGEILDKDCTVKWEKLPGCENVGLKPRKGAGAV